MSASDLQAVLFVVVVLLVMVIIDRLEDRRR